MIDINKLTPKDIEEKLPQIDGITKTIAQKVAAYAAKKRASGKIAFESKEELNKVLKSAKLNSRYMPGVMDTIAIVGAGIEPIGKQVIERLLPNFSYDKLVLEMQIELPASLRKFKKPEEVEIIKPDSETQQIKPNKDLALNTSLCEISNLPEKREEPIKTYNLLLSNINLDDFNGGAPLDNYERLNLNGVNFKNAINNYVNQYGEDRFRFKRNLDNQVSLSIPSADKVSELLEYLTNKGLYYLLYHTTSSPELQNFRMKYLGWDTQFTNSLYSIDEIEMKLRSSASIANEIKLKLLEEIERKRTETQSLATNDMPFKELDTVDYINRKLQSSESADAVTDIFSQITIQPNSTPTTKTYPVLEDFPIEYYINKLSTGIEHSEIVSISAKLEKLKDFFKSMDDEFGAEWNIPSSNFKTFNNKIFKVKGFYAPIGFKEFAQKIKDEFYRYATTHTHLFSRSEAITTGEVGVLMGNLDIVKDQLNSGVVVDNIISSVVYHLRNSLSVVKHVPDFLSHAVMLKDSNKDIFLVTPPENRLRLDNLLDYAPNMGIVTEFSLEILHQKFGFGKHLYSESLFPGEEVTLEVSSKSKKEVEVTTTSSEKIFEEANEKTSSDFQEEVNKELNDSYNKNLTSSESVNLSASGGVFGISLSAGYNNQSSSSETINNAAKKVNNVTNKLAKELSDQRQVTFEKSTTEKSIYSSEEENKSTRKFVNINKERTLTFNFFQITREYQSTLYLEDIELLYSTGKFNFATIFINVEDIYDLTNQENVASISELKQFLNKVSANTVQTVQHLIDSKTIRKLPSEFSDNFEKGAVMIVYSPPYSQTIPLSQANYFLANTFKPSSKTQKELNNLIWKFIGNGSVSPDGIGVGAFPFSWDDYESDESIEWPETQRNAAPSAEISTHKVVADKIKVVIDKKKSEFELPNLDLCFNKVRHFRTRYVLTAENRNSLPLAVMQKNYVINTNGVYCENMLGNCGALELYATEHRDIDVQKSRVYLEQERAKIPPSLSDFKSPDGTFDIDSYNVAVQNFCMIQKALNSRIVENPPAE